ncbi:hypothetical protein QBC36DRAFT_192351, partial [Triangularia setosa]
SNQNNADECNFLSPNSLRTLPSHHSLSKWLPSLPRFQSNSPQLCGLLSRTGTPNSKCPVPITSYMALQLACITILRRRARDAVAHDTWVISISMLPSLRGDGR